MKSVQKPVFKKLTGIICAISLLLILGGCAEMNLGGSSSDDTVATPATTTPEKQATTENQPYYPTEFNDLLIPGELSWNREKSMSLRTDSFAGGILNFSGRVEINSLTTFFISSMAKNGWKMVGSLKQKTNLLIFVKPHKTLMITISGGEFSSKTDINVYLTEDIAAAHSPATSEESFN
ncbi:MAG: hypothetical protein OEL55_06445 [Desulfobulbaceae bacterium]|nr:hypothetical protein [Desulfobulbaceae bacterium]